MEKSSLEEVEVVILIKEEEEEMVEFVLFLKDRDILWTVVTRSMDIHQTRVEEVEIIMLIW